MFYISYSEHKGVELDLNHSVSKERSKQKHTTTTSIIQTKMVKKTFKNISKLEDSTFTYIFL